MIAMKVCFLGYDRSQTRLISTIEETGCKVDHFSEKVDDLSPYDLIISFGYRHIISAPQLALLSRPALNLHISLLPYNRGAHPNFWSWIENTPAGVTIHEIDEGIDTGPICCQKEIVFDDTTVTFSDTYSVLFEEIEKLFIENIYELLKEKYRPKQQVGSGSYHSMGDLPDWMDDWDMAISDAKRRFDHDT